MRAQGATCRIITLLLESLRKLQIRRDTKLVLLVGFEPTPVLGLNQVSLPVGLQELIIVYAISLKLIAQETIFESIQVPLFSVAQE